MFRSIRWTLQLWHAAILLAALASFGTALYVGVSRVEYQRIDAELEGAARVLASGPMDMNPDHGHGPGGRGGPGGWDNHGGSPGHPGPDGAGGPSGQRGPGGPPPWDDHGSNFFTLNFPGATRPSQFNGQDSRDRPGPPPRMPMNWWAQIPQDALRRIGRNELDQPYFAIWGNDNSLIRASSPSGDVLTGTPLSCPTQVPESGDAPATIRDNGSFREVIVPGPSGIKVLVGKSMQPERSALAHLRWTLFAAGAGVMAIGLLGGWMLSERATRPIRAISATAQLISASDLSRRIGVDETKSELGSLARTLNDTFERLETSFGRQVRFTADASHELRTPLTVIHSHAELALKRDRSPEEYRTAIETCFRAAKRMKALVETLLVLARADSGQLEIRREPFDLKDLAEECLAMVSAQAQEHKVTIASDLRSITMQADRTRISQLIINLLSNAIRYNHENGAATLTINQQDSTAIISVADTGVGIAREDQPRVFERFFRADKARSREAGGSGLGLAICQSIAQAHHGTISFTSQPGVGTTFTAHLPLA